MSFTNDEADRLNSYLDAHAQDRLAKPDGLDPELAATYERIQAMNARSTPDPALKTALWRNLMNTFEPALPFSPQASSQADGRRKSWIPRLGHGQTTQWRGPRLALNGIAAIALIALIGSSLYFLNRPPSKPGPIAAFAPFASSPTPPATPATGCSTDPLAYESIFQFAPAAYSPSLASDPTTSVKFWQLQGWRVSTGATVDYTAAASANATDFVLSGFYEATFGGTATISRQMEYGWAWSVTTVQPGTKVDLTFGDSVSFDPSKGVTIDNLSSSVDIVFKRALFTAAPISSTPVLSGARSVIDSGGALPSAAISPANGGALNSVSLQFLPAGRQLPCDGLIHLGAPVGALVSGPSAGYFLVITASA